MPCWIWHIELFRALVNVLINRKHEFSRENSNFYVYLKYIDYLCLQQITPTICHIILCVIEVLGFFCSKDVMDRYGRIIHVLCTMPFTSH